MPLICRLHITSRGNLFLKDLAQLLANVLVDLGVSATVVSDGIPTGESGVVDIVVGPHEYFVIDSQLPLERRQEIAAASVLLTTEQPGSPFWDVQREFVAVAAGTLDINATAIAAFAAEGIVAHRLRLGYHPSLDLWGGPIEGVDTGREIDVAFLGGATPRRLEMLSESAAVLSHRESRLLLHDPFIPVQAPSPWFVSGLDKAALLRSTKLLLNVHNTTNGYFEWVRAIEAICNGALLLTEPALDSEPFEAFRHYVAADPALFPAHITALLADEPRRVRMAEAAYDLLRSDLRMTDHVRDDILPILEEQAGRSVPVTVTQAEFTRLDPGRPRDPIVSADTHRSDDLVDTRSRLRDAIIEARRRGRLLARAELELAGDDPGRVDEATTPAWDELGEAADVTVVIPLYNYEDHVVVALDSVFASRAITPEVVVVDDCSTDGSAEVVRTYMADHPDRPVLGLFRALNAGPSTARNLGRSRARSSRLFLLDADNALYPDGLAILREALDRSDAPVAYGILEMFGDMHNLVSALPWSVESLTLRPYIDNMAMVQAATVDSLGGFPDDGLGLEDYRFYVALAARGDTPVWVPRIVGRYRLHTDTSAGAVDSLDHRPVLELLRSEHPDLPWPAEQP